MVEVYVYKQQRLACPLQLTSAAECQACHGRVLRYYQQHWKFNYSVHEARLLYSSHYCTVPPSKHAVNLTALHVSSFHVFTPLHDRIAEHNMRSRSERRPRTDSRLM